MKIEIHELATKEFDEAINWYDLQSSGLGARYKKVVLKEIRRIKQSPLWFLKETETIYKAYIPKFPYKVLFTLEKDRIIIWSISHLHRKPWHWQSRMK